MSTECAICGGGLTIDRARESLSLRQIVRRLFCNDVLTCVWCDPIGELRERLGRDRELLAAAQAAYMLGGHDAIAIMFGRLPLADITIDWDQGTGKVFKL